MQIHNHTPSLECDGALSDLILQAARAAIPANVERLITLPASGARNQPLLPLLVGLLDAAQATAKAVADNAWDDCLPLDRQLATDLAKQCRAIAADIENASQCPDATCF
jgi:hypothetical protein